MPYENLNEDRSVAWRAGDWYSTSACASFSATPLQVAPSAGVGYDNYISTINFSSVSAQYITMWDGASAVIAKFYIGPATNNQYVFPRGLEIKVPTTGSNIKALSTVSATTDYLITGFKIKS